jgi:acetyltransferase-like isoleucine patch superfamily enzyme
LEVILFLKIVLFRIGIFFSLIYPFQLSHILNRILIKIYSGWLSRQFHHYGINSIIRYPVNSIIGSKYIYIGNKTSIGKFGVLTAWDSYLADRFKPQIIIGDNVSIGDYCHITAINKIVLGNGVLTGRWVTITDNSHGKIDPESFVLFMLPPVKRPLYSPGSVVIDENVWIGDKVTILPNVHIGKNAVIGANAVVTKDIPANCVVAGNPAKVIKAI